MRTKFLYAIVHPETNEPVYIGQTFNPDRRLQEHKRGSQVVDQWIRDMISRGQSPSIQILSRHHHGINRAERSTIIRMNRKYQLFNQLIPVNA